MKEKLEQSMQYYRTKLICRRCWICNNAILIWKCVPGLGRLATKGIKVISSCTYFRQGKNISSSSRISARSQTKQVCLKWNIWNASSLHCEAKCSYLTTEHDDLDCWSNPACSIRRLITPLIIRPPRLPEHVQSQLRRFFTSGGPEQQCGENRWYYILFDTDDLP